MSRERIGVWICECGSNIQGAVDVADLVMDAGMQPYVAAVRVHPLLCDGKETKRLAEAIRADRLTRMVFAACSPKEHEKTFQEIMRLAGLNPFLMQTVNLREQCSWMVKDRTQATRKARAMIRGAVARVLHHEPLTENKMACCPDVLVLGAGIAGVNAALTLAGRSRKVYLVEKDACLGGRTARYETVFPDMACASCMIAGELDAVLAHESIKVLTLSRVTDVKGYFGHFQVTVTTRPRGIDPTACLGCSLCISECPVIAPDDRNEGRVTRKAIGIPYPGALPHVAAIDPDLCLRYRGEPCRACEAACQFGAIRYDDKEMTEILTVGAVLLATGCDLFDPAGDTRHRFRKGGNVLTAAAFEQMLAADGPTSGNIRLSDGRTPETIAFVHCVGSRTPRHHPYCSTVCCLYTAKLIRLTAKKSPRTTLISIYSDQCLPGTQAQRFHDDTIHENPLHLIRTPQPDAVAVREGDDGVNLSWTDESGQTAAVKVDLAVLAPAMIASSGAADLGRMLDVGLDSEGFFSKAHPHLSPTGTPTRGVYVAGCAAGPKSIASSATEAVAAAGRILAELVPGQSLSLEPFTAEVASDRCSGCRICMNLCPFSAITYDLENECAVIQPVLCRGCGMCGAACPSGAILCRHFTDSAIEAEMSALL